MSVLTGDGNGRRFIEGNGSPNGVVTGSRGDIYSQKDGTPGNTFWIKDTGDGTNTGWISLVASSIGGSGTLNTIAMFTPDGTHIGNSALTQSGSAVSAAGDFILPTDATYEYLGNPVADGSWRLFRNGSGTGATFTIEKRLSGAWRSFITTYFPNTSQAQFQFFGSMLNVDSAGGTFWQLASSSILPAYVSFRNSSALPVIMGQERATGGFLFSTGSPNAVVIGSITAALNIEFFINNVKQAYFNGGTGFLHLASLTGIGTALVEADATGRLQRSATSYVNGSGSAVYVAWFGSASGIQDNTLAPGFLPTINAGTKLIGFANTRDITWYPGVGDRITNLLQSGGTNLYAMHRLESGQNSGAGHAAVIVENGDSTGGGNGIFVAGSSDYALVIAQLKAVPIELFINGSLVASHQSTGDFYHTGDTLVDSTSYTYIGSSTVDGSWRFRINGTDLVFERREAGNWIEKGAFTA